MYNSAIKKIVYLIIMLNAWCAGTIYSQNSLPPSPDAIAASGSAGSLYNGKVPVNIPLGTMNSKELSLPVNMYYSGGGIGVGQIASCVGLGWEIGVGGLITRTVRGLPDDTLNNTPDSLIKGYINGGGSSLPDPSTHPTNNQLLSYINEKYDGEPDIFYFSFNGRSGSFMFDPQKNCYFSPDEKLKINVYYTSGSAIDYFLITDEMGIKYTFGGSNAKERIHSVISKTYTTTQTVFDYTSTWFLVSIQTPDSKDQITFTYRPFNYSIDLLNCELVDPPAWSTIQQITTNLAYKSYNIDYISSPVFKIAFEYGERRCDLYSTESVIYPKSLKKIKFYNKTSGSDVFLKEYLFSYAYASSSQINIAETPCPGNGLTDYRLMLNSITEQSGSLVNNPYVFEYYWKDNKGLPDRYTSKQLDHWGYYNGATANTNLIVVSGADRDADVNFAKVGSLKKKTFPAGGSQTFNLELNEYEFWENNQWYTKQGGGLRVSSIGRTNNDGSSLADISYGYGTGSVTQDPYYELGYDKDLGAVYTSNSLYPLLTISGGYVCYESVGFSDNITGSTALTFNSIDDYPDDWQAYEGSWRLFTTNNPGYPIYPVLVRNEDWRRGTIASVIKSDANGNDISETVYTYTDIDPDAYPANYFCFPSNGLTDYDQFRYSYYQMWTGYKRLLNTVTEKIYDKNNPANYITKTTRYYYDNNYNHYNPVRIETDNGKGGKISAKTKYVSDYNLSTLSDCGNNCTTYNIITALKNQHMTDLPLEQQVWEQETSASDYMLVSGSISFYCGNQSTYFPYKAYSTETDAPLSSTNFGEELTSAAPYTQLFPNCTYYKEKIKFNDYDVNNYNNLLEYVAKNGNQQATIWGYNNFYPIAKISNANYTKCYYSSFEENNMGRINCLKGTSATARTGSYGYAISSNSIIISNVAPATYKLELWVYTGGSVSITAPNCTVTPINNNITINSWTLKEYKIVVNSAATITISGTGVVDDARLYPFDAAMISYTYNTKGLPTSGTDANNVTVYYEYDNLGRTIKVTDENGNLLQKNEYHNKQ